MTATQLTKFRQLLLSELERIRSDAQSVEEKAMATSGGQADGGLSNAPMHLADMGTDMFLQELNETLLENERYVLTEISAALARIEKGSFGVCEGCGTQIIDARIEALPHTRYCISCAERIRPEPDLNLRSPSSQPSSQIGGSSSRQDVHAAGTAGGGTALGGLAGTNQGHGDPAAGNIERANASGDFDHADDVTQAEPVAGFGGGAAGGTPAGKRSSGGTPRRVKGLHRTNRAPASRKKRQAKE